MRLFPQDNIPKPTLFTRQTFEQWFLKAPTWCWALLLLLVLMLPVGSFALGFYYRPEIIQGFHETGISGGSQSLKVIAKNLVKTAWHTPGRYITALFQAPRVESMTIDLKFKHYHQLLQIRDAALKQGQLIHSEETDDYVPATIHYLGSPVKVMLRLKGDWTDHLQGDKWSFRIKTKNGQTVAGMRRFSLQAPHTRGYQSEMLFMEHLRREGILVPRYSFVRVILNGKDIGLMAMEEHFSKELLESQQRKASAILRLDESLQWASYAMNYRPGIYSSYTTAPVKAFGDSALMEDPASLKELETATGLMRGFIEARLPASDVFDVELLGRFLAVSELWDAGHGLMWNNTRFAYNPITGKFEPIGYDADVFAPTGENRLMAPNRMVSLAPRMLEDAEVRKHYLQTIHRISNDMISGNLVTRLRKYETPHLRILHQEMPWIPSYDFTRLQNRAQVLSRLNNTNYNDYKATFPQGAFRYPKVLQAYWIVDGREGYLELMNPTDRPVAIEAVRLKSGKTLALKSWPDSGKVIKLPLHLAPTTYEGQPERVRISLASSLLDLLKNEQEEVQIDARLEGEEQPGRITAERYFASLAEGTLPRVSREELLGKHPYLIWPANSGQAFVRPGRWQVKGALVLPKGLGLTLPAGTTLLFEKEGALIVQGAVRFKGTAQHPVQLDAKNPKEGWQGLAVLNADKKSELEYVTIAHTHGHQRAHWQLTGSTVFYRSPVTMKQCLLIHNRSEDALNIIRTRFDLQNTSIHDTASDAMDSDFSTGRVLGGHFKDIGGDGIDVSGTRIALENVRFNNVHDKAVSIGEASNAIAHGLQVDGAGTGLACKDRSSTKISHSSMRNIRHVALMGYQKKEEYGPAIIEAAQILLEQVGYKALAQTKSKITIDGHVIPTRDVDIDKIYQEGYMKK